MSIRQVHYLLLLVICVCAGCANITSPTGGKKDIIPPKLLYVTPADSMRNTRVGRIELMFDEYITVSDASKEVEISPILPIAPTVTGINKHVVVKIVDSLLEDSTTYRISFGNAIKDLHESNPFPRYTYTFSTCGYFDSLQLRGSVINAATGLVDSGSTIVVLYGAADNDSAIVKRRPKYMAKVDGQGMFQFGGLPHRRFRIYAVKDANTNMMYDGGEEMIAFSDTTILPGDSTIAPIQLRMFAEPGDTALLKKGKPAKEEGSRMGMGRGKEKRGVAVDSNFSYTIKIDTADIDKRSFDITRPLDVTFSRQLTVFPDKITLTYDSADVTVTPVFTASVDTIHNNILHINTSWQENTVYTLGLDSAFAKDTAGIPARPSRYVFRTNSDDDYGKMKVNLSPKYIGKVPLYTVRSGTLKASVPDLNSYVLLVKADDDTVYQKTIKDTVISLTKLRPAKYTFRIIVDKNKNGKWDAGDLFGRIQPEVVIPSAASVTMKPGWEHIIDFEQAAKPKMSDKKDRMKDKAQAK